MRKQSDAGFSALRLLGAGILAVCSSSSLAAGFALIEQSASQQGNAFAGASAFAGDASTLWFNPAGLTRVPQQLIVAGHAIRTVADFNGSANTILGTPVSGGEGGDAGGISGVPNLYYALPLGTDMVFGLGINVPFGLSTEYDKDWRGRYQAVKSEVSTVNINPSLAFRINKDFSLGVGVSLQYIKAKLTQAVDQGSLCVAQNGAAVCTGLGLTPGASDAFADIEGDDWSTGFNFGLLFQATDSTRIGLSYRSKVKHRLEGDADFSNTHPAFSGTGLFVDAGVEAKIDLPNTASLSLYQDLGSQWSVMADITWTGWSSFDELRIQYDDSDSNQPDSVTDESWNNNMRYAIGLDYRASSAWTFRGGVALDKTPIPDNAHRTPRIPGEDRLWVSVGFGYRMSEAFGVDVGYSHLFVNDPESNHSSSGGTIQGDYDASVDILSAQLVWNI